MANFDPLSMIGNIPSTVLGMALTDWQNQNQYDQQKKLQDLQIKGQMQLGEFNQGLALDTWRKTSYPEQVKLMQQAGLNVGLMYGGAGSGGTTQGGQAGSVSSSAPIPASHAVGMAMQMGLATKMQEAQIENVKADTELKKAELPGPKIGQEKTTQETQNLATQGDILKLQKAEQEIKNNIAKESQWNIISKLGYEADKMFEEVRNTRGTADVTEATVQDRIKQIQIATSETMLRMSAMKMGIQVDSKELEVMQAGITNLLQQRQQDWFKIGQEQKRIEIQKALSEMHTNTPTQIKQWTDIATDILDTLIGGAQKLAK